jgi:HlyD family secretion protein
VDLARVPQRRLSRAALIAGGAGLFAIATALAAITLFRSDDAGPLVDRSTIVTDVARRGDLERSIGAAGTLASEDLHVVSALEPGTVDELLVKPGTRVRTGDVIARLENADLEEAVVDARSAVDVANAVLASAHEQAEAAALTRQSALASAEAQMQVDATNARSLETLHRGGLVADATFRIAEIKASESHRQVVIGRAQQSVGAADDDAKIAAARAQLEQASALLAARESHLAALVVRARSPGVVQSVAVDLGSRVEVGTQVAQIADVQALKAVLQVAESQAHDVVPGMTVRVDTGSGIAVGSVARIAPAALNGSVAVDVLFGRALPRGARPDLNVDGTIELERLPDVTSIARPAGASDDAIVDLYRLSADGSRAALVRIALGRGSADRVAVRSGLNPGDTVIVSDTSAYDGHTTLRLR